MQPSRPMSPQDAAALVLVAIIWGVFTVATRYALLHLPPLLAVCLRLVAVAVLLIPFWRPAIGAWRILALVGLLTGAHFGVQAWGVSRAADLAPMVIAIQLWIPAAAIFASLFLHERMGPWRIAGMGVALGGIGVLTIDGPVLAQWDAFALVTLAACLYGAASVIVRSAPPIGTFAYQAWIALTGLMILAPLTAAAETDHAGALARGGWGPILAMMLGGVFSSIIANGIMFTLVQRYEVSRTTPYMFLSPPVAIGLGAVVFGERLSPQFMIGAAMALVGVALVALAERRL